MLKAKTLKVKGTSDVEQPTCPNCKVPGVRVEMQKISPDKPGKQRQDVMVPQGQVFASKKKKKLPEFVTDCGLENCKSEEFHMLTEKELREFANLRPDADKKNKQKQMKDLRDIEESMNFLEIDG